MKHKHDAVYVGEHEVYLMNPYTGSVDTAENWKLEGYDPEGCHLIEVKFIKGEWIEAD